MRILMGHPYRRRPDGAGLERYTDLSELWDEDELTWSEISITIAGETFVVQTDKWKKIFPDVVLGNSYHITAPCTIP